MDTHVWLLVFAIGELALATAVLVYFIRRSKTRPCRSCGKRVDRRAEKCPNCGHPLRRT